MTEREKIAHLLRRFGLGASEAELDFYGRDGLDGTIRRLLDDASAPADPEISLEAFRNPKNGSLSMGAVVNAWTARMVMTQRPLREKMTLFWHDHFATSASKVRPAEVMRAQIETLRTHALGNFGDLLMAVSKDPAMLYWLDNQENVKDHPNENFARELLELFTLGIGHYTETDVREAARAFTGWSIRRNRPADLTQPFTAEYLFRPQRHDFGTKRLLGHENVESGEQVLGILASHPTTYVHLSKKLWEWFVYPNPSPTIVQRVAQVFENAKGDISVVLRAIMTSPEFYSTKAVRAIVKNPVDVVVATMRQVGLGPRLVNRMAENSQAALRSFNVPSNAMKKMGMSLMFPPNVAGWDTGQAWVTTATMVERMAWSSKLFTRASTVAAAILTPGMSPESCVLRLASVLDIHLASDRLALLTKAAQSLGEVSEKNASAHAAAITRYMFAMPEFQFC